MSSLFFSCFKAYKTSTSFITWSSIVFMCFSNALPIGKHINWACSIILLRPDSNAFSSIRYSYLSNLSDDDADIFAASLLTSYCSFSSLILSSINVINFYIFSTRLVLQE